MINWCGEKSNFSIIPEAESRSINGGGPGGFVVGYVVGGVVGTIMQSVAYNDSIRSGSTAAKAEKAGATVYLSCMTTCTFLGSLLPF